MSLTKQAGRSAFWQFAGGGWSTFVRLGASVFLARALTPDDYGVFGMAILTRELLENLGSVGMGTGLIAKKSVTEEDLSTCFWCLATIRLLMFLFAFFGAPLAGMFFNDSRVTEVVRVISLAFLISILSGTSVTLLTKELKFKAINVIRCVGALLESGLAVYFALNTALGYWALVVAMLAGLLFTNFSIFIFARWKPRLVFCGASFKYLFRYGINGFGFSIANYFQNNLDYLLVGRLMGTASLGLYEFSYRIPHLVENRISRPVGAVIFPALSKVQDDETFSIGYMNAVKYVSVICFPLIFGLAAVAEVAVPVLWGSQWASIIDPLRILCLCAALRIVVQPLGAIFNCKNRPDLPFKISMISLVWTASVVCVLGYKYGINGVASGMVLSVLPSYVALLLAFRMMRTKVFQLVRVIWPVLLSAVFCGLAAYFASVTLQKTDISLFSVLMISTVSGALIYILSFFIFFQEVVKESFVLLKEVSGQKINLC